MRTETITKEIYSFDELSEEAQQYAIEKFRDSDSYLDYNWWDFVYEYWVEKLAEHGFDVITTENRMSYKWDKDLNRRVENGKKDFKEININFSGFYSQGDGASFTCKRIDVKQWIIKNNLKKYGRLVKSIDSNVLDIFGCIKRDRWHNYIHWNTISVLNIIL